MRFSDYDHRKRILLHGTALILLSAMATGCSSEVIRFSETDLVTGATSNQQEIIGQTANQPYPGDYAAAPAYTGPADLTGGTVSRSALAPAMAAAPDSSGASVAALAPVTQPAASTMAAASAALPQAPGNAPAGWSNSGGTEITLQPGETIYNLSRRFGVPVQDILKANNIADGNAVKAGTTLVVPTYAYSRQNPVSAPDNHPKVASANAGVSVIDARPQPQSPASVPAPARDAVLPDTPKTREAASPAAPDASGARPAGNASNYKVVAGDTLNAIARRHGVTTTALKQANGLSDGMIRVGQVLHLPGAASAQPQQVAAVNPAPTAAAQASETLPKYTPPARRTDEMITDAGGEAPDATGVGKMRWPARGRIISEFGKTVSGRRNDGVDIALPACSPVRAAENGVVIYAGDSLKDFGNTVLLRHENGLVTVYGHADKLKVARGDIVRRGDEIAISGMTGAAEMPKLHFEVRDNSVPQDPLTYLQ